MSRETMDFESQLHVSLYGIIFIVHVLIPCLMDITTPYYNYF